MPKLSIVVPTGLDWWYQSFGHTTLDFDTRPLKFGLLTMTFHKNWTRMLIKNKTKPTRKETISIHFTQFFINNSRKAENRNFFLFCYSKVSLFIIFFLFFQRCFLQFRRICHSKMIFLDLSTFLSCDVFMLRSFRLRRFMLRRCEGRPWRCRVECRRSRWQAAGWKSGWTTEDGRRQSKKRKKNVFWTKKLFCFEVDICEQYINPIVRGIKKLAIL